ncbi:hypothetical protein ACLOJK_006727 [Asimina triloba]
MLVLQVKDHEVELMVAMEVAQWGGNFDVGSVRVRDFCSDSDTILQCPALSAPSRDDRHLLVSN